MIFLSLILIGIFALVIWGYRTISLKNPGRKLAKWLIVGYSIILVAGTVVSYTSVSVKKITGKTVSNEDAKKQERSREKLYDQAMNKGEFHIDDDVLFKSSEKSFPYKRKKITVSVPESYEILVDRDQGFNGEVIVTHYMSKTIVGNADVTEKRKKASISLKDSMLNVNIRKTSLNLAKYSEGFVFHQFNGEKREAQWEGEEPVIGYNLIYLKVPKGVKLEGNGVEYINYVTVK